MAQRRRAPFVVGIVGCIAALGFAAVRASDKSPSPEEIRVCLGRE